MTISPQNLLKDGNMESYCWKTQLVFATKHYLFTPINVSPVIVMVWFPSWRKGRP